MATVHNPDGTVSEFKIGQDDEVSTTVSVKLNKDGSVRKKRGPAKKDNTPKKVFGAAIPVTDYDSLVAEHGSVTKGMNYLLSLYRQTKGN